MVDSREHKSEMSDRLKKFIDGVNSYRKLEKAIGYDHSLINKMANGGKEINNEAIDRFAVLAGLNPTWLKEGKGEMIDQERVLQKKIFL